MSKQYNISEQSEEQQKTRERIIAAASKVLAEKGYDATTLREISREAQAAPGLVHYYFGGKDQLLVEVLEASGRRFSQETEQLVQHVPADQSGTRGVSPALRIVLAWLTQSSHRAEGARKACPATEGDWLCNGNSLEEHGAYRGHEEFISRSSFPGGSSALHFRWASVAKDHGPYLRY